MLGIQGFECEWDMGLIKIKMYNLRYVRGCYKFSVSLSPQNMLQSATLIPEPDGARLCSSR